MKSLVLACSFCIAFIFLSSWDLRNPYYAAIGDEYPFYDMAKSIIAGNRPDIFSQRGVYGYHPILDSYYQAIIMNIFGQNVFGWKISAILLTGLSISIFYFFLKKNFNQHIAVIGSLFMTTSHYLLALTHTGYNNIHSFFPLFLSLLVTTEAKKRKNYFFLFLAGLTSGLGFYTFYAARITIVIVIFYLFFNSKISLKSLGWLFSGFILSLLPFILFNQENIVLQMTQQTFLRNPSNNESLITFFLKNIGISFEAIFIGSYKHIHHYVSGSLIDSVSGVTAIGGLIALLLKKKWKQLLFLVSTIIFLVSITGGLFYEHTVAITRLFIVLPFLFTTSAIGIYYFLQPLRHSTFIFASIYGVIITIVLCLNMYRFYVITPSVHPKTKEVIILEEIMRGNTNRVNNYGTNNILLNHAIEAYGLKDSFQ